MKGNKDLIIEDLKLKLELSDGEGLTIYEIIEYYIYKDVNFELSCSYSNPTIFSTRIYLNIILIKDGEKYTRPYSTYIKYYYIHFQHILLNYCINIKAKISRVKMIDNILDISS